MKAREGGSHFSLFTMGPVKQLTGESSCILDDLFVGLFFKGAIGYCFNAAY